MSLVKAGLAVIETSVPSAGPADGVKDYIRQVRNRIVKRKIRLTELFKDSDKMHRGIIARVQFVRGIYAIGVHITQDQIDELVKIYRDKTNEYTDDVNYKKFCEDVEEAFVSKDLVRSPRKNSPKKWSDSQECKEADLLSFAERDRLEKLLITLKNQVETHRIATKSYFKDFDKFNRGFVTETRFRRGLRTCFHKSFTENQESLLCRAYALETEDRTSASSYVNYRDFIRDVDPQSAATGTKVAVQASTKIVTAMHKNNSTLDLDAIEARIVRQIVSKSMPIKNALRDFDGLRTGHCTVEQFKRALVKCGLHSANEAELNALGRKYYVATKGKVRYVDFLGVVAGESRRVMNATSDTPASESRSRLEDESPKVRDVMQTIKQSMIQKRYAFRDLFSDFDRRHQGKITRTQFRRALTFYNINYLVGESNVDLIIERFADEENPMLVRYKDFVRILGVEERKDACNVVETSATPEAEEENVRDVVDLAGLLSRIKGITKRRRLRIREFLKDFDSLRSGSISRDQLEKGMSISGIRISTRELEAIADAYPANLLDLSGKSLVRWTDLCDDLESIFTRKGLERNPKIDVVASVSAAREGIDGDEQPALQVAGSSEEANVLRVLRNIAQTSKLTFASDVAQELQDFDKSRSGCVTPSQFQRAMRAANVCGASAADVDALVSAFKIVKSYVSSVSYRSFLRALDRVSRNEANPFQEKSRHLVETHAASSKGARRPANRGAIEYQTKASVEEILAEMADIAVANRMRLAQFFHDYDPFRRGYIPTSKLETALSSAGFKFLGGGDMRLLKNKFRHPQLTDKIIYTELLACVDPCERDRRQRRKP